MTDASEKFIELEKNGIYDFIERFILNPLEFDAFSKFHKTPLKDTQEILNLQIKANAVVLFRNQWTKVVNDGKACKQLLENPVEVIEDDDLLGG